MTATDRLLVALSKLGQEEAVGPGGWRTIRPGPSYEGHPICHELAETILPSLLTFQNSDGAELTVEAGNRRLYKLLPPAAPSLAEFFDIFERTLDSGEEALPARVGSLLRAFSCQNALQVNVRAKLLTTGRDSNLKGIGADLLNEALWEASSVPSPISDPTEAVADFIADITPYCSAWILFVGDDVKAHDETGPDPEVLRLRASLPNAAVVSSNPSAPSLMAVGPSDDEMTPCVALWFEDWVFCARDVRSSPETLGATWRSHRL